MVYTLTFYLRTPVILTAPLHLDALLSAVHPDMHGGGVVSKITDKSEIRQAPLPLDSAKLGRAWVWCASAAEFADDAQYYEDKFARRKTDHDYLYMRGRQTRTFGPQKDLMAAVYGVVTPWVRFLASSANLHDLRHIAKRIKSVGAHREKGYGQVERMEIQPVDLDFTACLVDDGRARRNLPGTLAEGRIVSMVNVRPPYWHACTMEQGVTVGGKCRLREGVWLNENRRAARK